MKLALTMLLVVTKRNEVLFDDRRWRPARSHNRLAMFGGTLYDTTAWPVCQCLLRNMTAYLAFGGSYAGPWRVAAPATSQ